MRFGKRGLSRTLVAAVAVLAVAACGSDDGNDSGESSADGTPKAGGDLRVATLSQPASLDPAICSGSQYIYCSALYGTLARYNVETQEFDPVLLESLDTPDGKTWTLKLRDGMTFSDGTPYDAEAVIFNWERELADPTLLSQKPFWLNQMSYKSIDPQTIEVVLDAANYNFPWALTYELSGIGSPTAIKEAGTKFGTTPVGAGPFVLDEWIQGSEVRFSKNSDYVIEGQPYVDTLTIQMVTDDDQRGQALQAGELDMTATFLKRIPRDLEAQGFKAYASDLLGGTGLLFNHDDPVAGNANFKCAVLHAIDAPQITNATWPGDEPPDSFWPTDSPYRDADVKYPALDLEAAQKCFDDFLAETERTSLDIELLTNAPAPVMKTLAETAAAQLNKIEGLNVTPVPTENAVLSGILREGKYQFSMGTAPSPTLSPTQMYRTFHSSGDLNTTNYSNPEIDAILDETLMTSEPEALTQLWKDFAKVYVEDPAHRVLAWEQDIMMTADYVRGVNNLPLYAATWDLVWFDK
jgi:peptide/nickel transport system substrate-binding protein